MIDHSRINGLKSKTKDPEIRCLYRKYQISHAVFVLKEKHSFNYKQIGDLFGINSGSVSKLIDYEIRIRKNKITDWDQAIKGIKAWRIENQKPPRLKNTGLGYRTYHTKENSPSTSTSPKTKL